jgi:membrane protein
MNQVVSLGLALGCGLLGMLSVAGTAGVLAPTSLVQNFFSSHMGTGFLFKLISGVNGGITFIAMKVFALIASILIFFLVYWLLPNAKVPAKAVLPAAVIVGIVFEVAKQIFVFLLPHLDFHETYGPFSISVTLVFWSYICGLLMLGGAHLSAVGEMRKQEATHFDATVTTDERALQNDCASA